MKKHFKSFSRDITLLRSIVNSVMTKFRTFPTNSFKWVFFFYTVCKNNRRLPSAELCTLCTLHSIPSNRTCFSSRKKNTDFCQTICHHLTLIPIECSKVECGHLCWALCQIPMAICLMTKLYNAYSIIKITEKTYLNSI